MSTNLQFRFQTPPLLPTSPPAGLRSPVSTSHSMMIQLRQFHPLMIDGIRSHHFVASNESSCRNVVNWTCNILQAARERIYRGVSMCVCVGGDSASADGKSPNPILSSIIHRYIFKQARTRTPFVPPLNPFLHFLPYLHTSIKVCRTIFFFSLRDKFPPKD